MINFGFKALHSDNRPYRIGPVFFIFVLIFFIFIGVLSNPIYSQEGHNDPLEEVVASDYLERHNAARNIQQLKRSVELDIRRLAVLVRNWSTDVEGSEKEYADIAAIYRKAVEAYYGGDALDSYRNMQAVRARSMQLYQKFCDSYRTKTVQIASDLSQKVIDLEVDPTKRGYGFRGSEAVHRLSVVRSQIRLGDELIRFKRPDRAIDQYRNARLLAILTAYHFETDANKQSEILKQYEHDLKDIGYHTENLTNEIQPDQNVTNQPK